jgi:hypothetical protein
MEDKNTEPRIVKAHCIFHLGDQIYNMILFSQIAAYLEENNIYIDYTCRAEHHNQVREFITTPNVRLLEYPDDKFDKDAPEYGLHMHIGDNRFPIHNFNYKNKNFDEFYVVWYNQVLEMLGIPQKIYRFEYTDTDLLIRYELLNEKYKDVDILIINSPPLSGQYNYHKPSWDATIKRLSSVGLNIVTTDRVDGIKCTLDDKLTLKSIGAISTRAKVIIAINTGPFSACFNSFAMQNVRRIWAFDYGNQYTNPKIQNARHINEIPPNFLLNICRAPA